MNSKRNNSGFTLIEVLTIMLVVAVLASVGLPGMTQMLDNNRLSTKTNRLISSLYAARSEAVKRNTDVVICTRNPAGNACDATSKNWDNGWIVKVGGETVDVAGELGGKLTFKPKTPEEPELEKKYTFSGDGMVNAGVNFRLKSTGDSKRAICLGSTGSIRSCTPPKDDKKVDCDVKKPSCRD